MKVSLVTTVKDAGPHIAEFLDSVLAQTRQPDEVIVVDGGSMDGTLEELQSEPGVMVLSEPGANISRGRNIGIRAATHDVLALTDADCVLDRDWLDRLVEPLERGADVSAGFYRPLATSFFEVCGGAVSLPERSELRPGWLPSSRSIAFRREAWEAAGGYPEWLEIGEDMYFNHRLIDAGVSMELAPEAVTWWRVRPTLTATWRQYTGYAEGDALGGMYPHRHALRFAAYGLVVGAAVARKRWLMALTTAAAVAYARRPLLRGWGRLKTPIDRARAIVVVPALMAFIDVAKMWGYIRGLRIPRAPG
jgi:glycosyltransferase involved in cell wall biosynthesis